MTSIATPALSIGDDLLDRIASRAQHYDDAGEFFADDFAELVAAGYYRAPVPVELGGSGTSLAELARWHRRIGYRGASTALASGMHLFWVGAAADRVNAGDESVRWILEAAGAGEIFAAGHSEPGNDLGLGGSTTEARPTADGYEFHGHKLFTSLSPVWTVLGVHGRDAAANAIVHGFVSRTDPGVHVADNWNTFALRATRSDDTVLRGARSPRDRIVAEVSPDRSDSAYLDSVSAWALVLTSNVYLAIGQRALDVAVAALADRPSAKLGGKPRLEDPFIQAALADSVIELDAIEAHLDATAARWSDSPVPDQQWRRRLLSAKHHATQGAQRVVERSLRVIGGRALRRGSVIERLYRDVAAGSFHNPTPETVRQALGSPEFLAPQSFSR